MLYILLTLFFVAFLSSKLFLLAGVASLALGIFLFLGKKTNWRLRRRVIVLTCFILLSVLPLLWQKGSSGQEVWFELWGWQITTLSLEQGVRVFLRSFTCLLSLLILTSYYPIYRILGWMKQHYVPILLVDLMELTYRYIYVLEDRVEQIALAQLARLGYMGWVNKIRHTNMLLARSFVLSRTEAEHLYNGLLTRAYETYDTPYMYQMNPNLTMDSREEVIVELKKISFAYPDTPEVLHQIDLSISSGEKLLILGLNGSGKSTLFLILSGIYPHSSGDYIFQGESLSGSTEHLRRIRQSVGIIFQNSNHQLFCPSVRDELAFGLRNMGLSNQDVDKRVDELKEEFDLELLLDKAPHQLSEGQKKWVAIASVVALRPSVLILDEPTASLDQVYSDKVMSLLDRLHHTGTTIVLSTHDRYLIEHWQGRVVRIDQGRILD